MCQFFLLMLFPFPSYIPQPAIFRPFHDLLPLRYHRNPSETTIHPGHPSHHRPQSRFHTLTDALYPRFSPLFLRPFPAKTPETYPNPPRSAGTYATHRCHTRISNIYSLSYFSHESLPHMACTACSTCLQPPSGTPAIPATNNPLYVTHSCMAPIRHLNDRHTWQALPSRFPFYPSVLWKITRERYHT